jgi:cell division septation protein DedD
VNLPLVGVVSVTPIPAAAPSATLLGADHPDEMKPVIDLLTQTRKSLTLRSLFMTGFPYDPEFFAAGLALARQWSRQGLKVALVDLDFRNPTVLRPKPHPNEGYVDALEYGCSFQRIAWELVNDALWLVGPGSHPPDERRLSEHPDWPRVMRTFAARVDVALYLAPFLDRKGFSGALSKRMDGVLIAASVRRSSRAALRDAFLELWGSDAPMIGCLGLDVPHVPARPDGLEPPPARLTEPPSGITRAHGAVSAERPQQALVERLSDEVRRGHVPRSAQPHGTQRSLGILWIVLLVVSLTGAGAWFAYHAVRREGLRAAPSETLPAGTERVLPADPGSPSPQSSSMTELPDPPPDVNPTETQEMLPYRVHVASFHSEKTVRDLVKALREKGLDAWYAKGTDQPDWYRVFVGHYATRPEAAQKAADLLNRGWVDHAMAYPDNAR